MVLTLQGRPPRPGGYVKAVEEGLAFVFFVTNQSKVCMYGVLAVVTEVISSMPSNGLVVQTESRCGRFARPDVATSATGCSSSALFLERTP